MTPYQLAEAFPDECKEFIPKVLPVLKSKLLSYREQVKRIDAMPVDEKTKGLYMMFVDNMIPIETKKRIETYEKAIEIVNAKEKDKWFINAHALASAKARPIESLYSFQRMKMGTSRISACCPFHDEKTPSFIIYRGSNSFNCFGCQANGDAVEFFMKLNKVTFKQAVEELSRWNT